MSQHFTADQWEEYFQQNEIPAETSLDSGARIINPKIFLATQIALLRHYGDASQGKICRDRLIIVKNFLEAAKNKG